MGAFVQQVNGSGAPDLIVKWRGKWLPIEVKSPGGKVRAGQQWYPIAHSLAEVMALFDD